MNATGRLRRDCWRTIRDREAPWPTRVRALRIIGWLDQAEAGDDLAGRRAAWCASMGWGVVAAMPALELPR